MPAGATEWAVEVAAQRVLLASARVCVKNDSCLKLLLDTTGSESNPTAATSGSSVVELTKGVLIPSSADRTGTALLAGSQDLAKPQIRVG